MEVGDMFFVPGTRNLSPYISGVGKRLGLKFQTRRLYMRQGFRKVWKPCEKDAPGATYGTGVWRVG